MIIVKHKTIDMTPEQIMQAAVEHNPPAGTVIDITDGTITIGPEGTMNLFGLVGKDYEMVCYQEEIEE